MIDGTQIGIFVLLAITLAVHGAFAGFFLYLRRRAKRIADGDLDIGMGETPRSVENMTEWLRLPEIAATHGATDRQPDRLGALVHAPAVRRLGRVIAYVLFRFRESAQPGGELHRRQVARLELSRSRRARRRTGASCSRSRSRCGRPASTTSRPRTRRWSFSSSASSSPGTSTTRVPTASSAAPDIKLIDARRIRWGSTATIPRRRTTSPPSTSLPACEQARDRPARARTSSTASACPSSA